jgi:hypothetical protein
MMFYISRAMSSMNKKSSRTGLTGSPENLPPGFEKLAYVFNCTYGHYPWDDWERAALAAGVPQDLAEVGRLTMREAFQHAWDERLQSLCGWRDQGRRMIKLALRSPEKAEKRWQRLLDTDGYRGEWVDGEWRPRQ